ncbi:MAG: SH3 domain-containing protein [Chloroflexi bacterium]|nr:SH3 domain-containing protein [Chloroflexota bacterium]
MRQPSLLVRILVTATAVTVLTSCSAGTEPVGPTATFMPTASVSASEDPAASQRGAAPTGLAVGTTVQVAADEVRLRTSAGTAGTITGSLVRGDMARVTGGPIESDGYTWYEVDGSAGRGWLAAGDESDPWIVSAADAAAAEALFRFSYGCDVTPPLVPPAFTLMSDGRVVVAGGDGWADGGWQVRQLTDAGLEQALAATLERPELQRSAEYWPERRPGADDPPGHGLCVYRFAAASGSGPVVVTSVSWFGEPEESTYYLPAPERRSLDLLARQLMKGGTFLGAEAWASAAHAYATDSFLVWTWQEVGPTGTDLPVLTETGPLGSSIEVFGEPVERGRCGYLTPEEAASLGAVLTAGGQPFSPSAISYGSVRTDDGWYTVVVSPRTPDGYPTCGDLPQ